MLKNFITITSIALNIAMGALLIACYTEEELVPLPAHIPLSDIIENAYVTNVICGVFVLIVAYQIQTLYSKSKLKKDFRCNEVICDIYDGINYANKIALCVTQLEKYIEGRETDSREGDEAFKTRAYINFYSEHKHEFYMANLIFTYPNNNLLLESIDSVFFINLNFKLLGIVNNIKNRKPNLERGYPSIKQKIEELDNFENERAQAALKWEIKKNITDLRLMSSYYKQLLDYLGYDHTLTDLRIESLKKRIPSGGIIDFLNSPIKQQNEIAREAELEALRKYAKTIIWRH